MAKTVTIHNRKFRMLIPSVKIQKAISSIAKKINKDYKNEKPLFLSVLNGSFIFSADLLKQIKCECEISFIKVNSYSGVKSTGKVNTLIGLNEDLSGRAVIIIEDIVDSGNTLEKILDEVKRHNLKSVKIAALFFKPRAYTKKIKLDYVGINVPDKFLLGYGLDYDGLGRNLKDVYVLDENPKS